MEDVIGKKIQVKTDVQTASDELVVKKGSKGIIVGDGFGFYDIKFEGQEVVQVVFANVCELIN